MMTWTYEPLLLSKQQLPEARAVLARAFQDDPLMAFITPDPLRRARLLPGFFETTLRYCLRYGAVYTTPQLEGVACWLPPGNTTPKPWGILSSGIHVSPFLLGLGGLRRIALSEGYAVRLHAQLARGRHWYLWVLGVDPARQRKGVGSALVEVVLRQADDEGLPCYLETQNPRNLDFYRRFGFQVASQGAIPGGAGLQIWALLRAAAAAPRSSGSPPPTPTST
jgi:ribosomal protein S18 acetylase RimI-like enzyme